MEELGVADSGATLSTFLIVYTVYRLDLILFTESVITNLLGFGQLIFTIEFVFFFSKEVPMKLH